MLENAHINVCAFFVAKSKIPTTLPLQLCHPVSGSAGLCLHLFMHIYLSLYCIVNTLIKKHAYTAMLFQASACMFKWLHASL